jgi:hypothetical protein
VQESVQTVVAAAKQYPTPISGLLFIGISAILFFHIQLMMTRAGYKTSYAFFKNPWTTNGWDTPTEYLKIRAKHGWSPWPAYLVFPCMLAGIGLLVYGLFRV